MEGFIGTGFISNPSTTPFSISAPGEYKQASSVIPAPPHSASVLLLNINIWYQWEDSVVPSGTSGGTLWCHLLAVGGQCSAIWYQWEDSVVPSGTNGRTVWCHLVPVGGQCGVIWYQCDCSVVPSGTSGMTVWYHLVPVGVECELSTLMIQGTGTDIDSITIHQN